MKNRFLVVYALLIFISLCSGLGYGHSPQPDYYLVVNLDTIGPQVSPTLYGVFFEDINHSVDGGLYAELVRNGSFEHTNQLEGWLIEPDNSALINATVETANPLNENNTHYLKLLPQRTESGIRIINIGYDGIPLEAGEQYCFSMYARVETQTSVPMRISIEDAKGNVYADGLLEIVGSQWQKYQLRLSAHHDSKDGRLVIRPQFQGSPCILCLDMVSLFPPDAWNGIMRSDLVEMLSNLGPGFLRFPGGCLVEGYSLPNAYRWKDTVGPVEKRRMKVNLWGYHQSYGIGFHEYFLLAKHLDAKPVPVLNAGMSCQVRGAQFAPMDEMNNWVQDALDLIEYANGSATSAWGNK
ncbi:MAG: carbohydrate binding domain-containing protein, partial [Alicyclobacillus sp.]|nr:carbohydrate binding domain-containing protein [Alicyclobacillus sp.]